MPSSHSRQSSASGDGRTQALDDLCGHWLLGQALVGRTGEEALFRLDERVVLGYLLFALLVYGRSIRFISLLKPAGRCRAMQGGG